MTLTEQLKQQADKSANMLPEEAKTTMKSAIDALVSASILEQAYKTGDKLPSITLPNARGTLVNIDSILTEGNKVILTFYRGGWCPYCNLELRALQHYLPQFEAKGAKLVAISPETPDNSLTTEEKNELTFEVLSDKNNEVAKLLNLVYTLPLDLQDLYLKFGINLDNSQGNTYQELPIAATYVINTNGVISYHFLEEDYKLRADPEAILEVL